MPTYSVVLYFNPATMQFSVTASSLSRSQAPVKLKRPTTFYDPNRGLSWDGTLSGKGRKPDWIKAAIEDGTIEFFRVNVQRAA